MRVSRGTGDVIMVDEGSNEGGGVVFDDFDRVTDDAAGLEGGMMGCREGIAQIGGEWVKVELPVLRDRAGESHTMGGWITGNGDDEIAQLRAAGTLPEDVQAIANLGFFEFA